MRGKETSHSCRPRRRRPSHTYVRKEKNKEEGVKTKTQGGGKKRRNSVREGWPTNKRIPAPPSVRPSVRMCRRWQHQDCFDRQGSPPPLSRYTREEVPKNPFFSLLPPFLPFVTSALPPTCPEGGRRGKAAPSAIVIRTVCSRIHACTPGQRTTQRHPKCTHKSRRRIIFYYLFDNGNRGLSFSRSPHSLHYEEECWPATVQQWGRRRHTNVERLLQPQTDVRFV